MIIRDNNVFRHFLSSNQNLFFYIFLEAYLLSNYGVTHTLYQRQLNEYLIRPYLGHIVDQFGRSLRAFHLEFDKEAIYDGKEE